MLDKAYMNKDFHLTEIKSKGKRIQIYDNILPLNIFKQIQNQILSRTFPWCFHERNIDPQLESLNPIEGYDDNINTYQFNHYFFPEISTGEFSDSANLISPILDIFNPLGQSLLHKANCGPREPKHLVGGWHCDVGISKTEPFTDSITGILYINTNNGYTLMETGDKIESIENRLILFPNDLLHTGITQTDTKVRVLINFNFVLEKKEDKKLNWILY